MYDRARFTCTSRVVVYFTSMCRRCAINVHCTYLECVVVVVAYTNEHASELLKNFDDDCCLMFTLHVKSRIIIAWTKYGYNELVQLLLFQTVMSPR